MSGSVLVGVLRAAAEKTRLRILALLFREELAVMELGQILGQSQPRVSRHLRILADSGLIERFPDGAWVFYRLATADPQRLLVEHVMGALEADADFAADLERLEAVRRERRNEAGAYFARNAARWDEIRSLYVDECDVEAAVLQVVQGRRFARMIDLGTGSGRMLTLLSPFATSALGLDLSQQMLNIARRNVAEAALQNCELRHGDILATGLSPGSMDLVVLHRVLHFLVEPASALSEAGRLVAPGGTLLIVDFAPHDLEHLRQAHQHRRLGFSDEEIGRWLDGAALGALSVVELPPAAADGLTVKIWSAVRPEAAEAGRREAA